MTKNMNLRSLLPVDPEQSLNLEKRFKLNSLKLGLSLLEAERIVKNLDNALQSKFNQYFSIDKTGNSILIFNGITVHIDGPTNDLQVILTEAMTDFEDTINLTGDEKLSIMQRMHTCMYHHFKMNFDLDPSSNCTLVYEGVPVKTRMLPYIDLNKFINDTVRMFYHDLGCYNY